MANNDGTSAWIVIITKRNYEPPLTATQATNLVQETVLDSSFMWLNGGNFISIFHWCFSDCQTAENWARIAFDGYMAVHKAPESWRSLLPGIRHNYAGISDDGKSRVDVRVVETKLST